MGPSGRKGHHSGAGLQPIGCASVPFARYDPSGRQVVKLGQMPEQRPRPGGDRDLGQQAHVTFDR
jgi:hypothetical protein